MLPRTRYILGAVFGIIIMLGSSTRAKAEERFSFDHTPGKLPKDVIPRHYELELKPDLQALTIAGRETIYLEVRQPTLRIVMNAAELEISSARMADGATLTTRVDQSNQLVTFEASAPIPAGKTQIEVAFKGKINESSVGMFAINYTAPSGKKRMVATQFEATDARRVFPCFDEPSFRATFGLTAEIPEELTAVSNMPALETVPAGGGVKRVKFARSPSMPTYLLVLVAGELQEIHGRAGKIATHIWFTEGKADLAGYALENSKRLLAYYHQYFGIEFPLPKLDHIALPSGFGGAMEHWGAITYNEGTILFDPKKSSTDDKIRTFGIMAHEMAHQWFGNLVTMAWWDNLWLNEGFASWMGTKTTDALNPQWNLWVRSEGGKAGLMAMDAQKSTHPIQRAVASESQIGDAFDHITYTKGMYFIRMLESYLGETAFRDGLRRYLKRHAYSNSTTADLWAALEEISHKPVSDFASGWTQQPGVPVIVASTRCENGKQQLYLHQERFTLLDPTAAPLRWKVPVEGTIVGKKRTTQVLVESEPVSLKVGRCKEAIKLNAGSRGYYHVAYQGEMFGQVRGAWARMNEADQVNFLIDAWSMVERGTLSAAEYLALLPQVTAQKSLAVWEQVLGTLSTIEDLLQGQAVQKQFEQKILSLLKSVTEKLGYEAQPGEKMASSVLRARLLGLLGTMGEPNVIAEARRRFVEFQKNEKSLVGDLRPVYLHILGEHSTPAEHETLVRLAKAATLEQDRGELLSALARARNPELARRALELSLTKDFPPVQAARLVSMVSATGYNAEEAWKFMRAHHRELMALVEGAFQNMYASSTVSGFSDESRAEEYLEFIRAHYPPDALGKANEAADHIRYSAYLKRLLVPAIEQWVR